MLGEAFEHSILVFPNPTVDVVGLSDIQGAVPSIPQDVDPIRTLGRVCRHGTGFFAFAQNDKAGACAAVPGNRQRPTTSRSFATIAGLPAAYWMRLALRVNSVIGNGGFSR